MVAIHSGSLLKLGFGEGPRSASRIGTHRNTPRTLPKCDTRRHRFDKYLPATAAQLCSRDEMVAVADLDIAPVATRSLQSTPRNYLGGAPKALGAGKRPGEKGIL